MAEDANGTTSDPPWQAYQEEAADFFRSLGFSAATNERLKGVRTHHDVDVVVRWRHAGFEVLWLIECKRWKTAVSQLHVLGFRQIVHELGADRGVILSEAGFQSGAHQAAVLTNVQLTSLGDLRVSASEEIAMSRIRDLQDRVDGCEERYWALDKNVRIEHGLRPPVGTLGYSATRVIETVSAALSAGARGHYPVTPDGLIGRADPNLAFAAATPSELLLQVEPHVVTLKRLLDDTEAAERGA